MLLLKNILGYLGCGKNVDLKEKLTVIKNMLIKIGSWLLAVSVMLLMIIDCMFKYNVGIIPFIYSVIKTCMLASFIIYAQYSLVRRNYETWKKAYVLFLALSLIFTIIGMKI